MQHRNGNICLRSSKADDKTGRGASNIDFVTHPKKGIDSAIVEVTIQAGLWQMLCMLELSEDVRLGWCGILILPTSREGRRDGRMGGETKSILRISGLSSLFHSPALDFAGARRSWPHVLVG
jgi:hypothetical protein